MWEDCGITCALPPFFVLFCFCFFPSPFPSRSVYEASNPGHSSASSQILESSTRTTACAHHPHPARYPHPCHAFALRQTFVVTSTWALGTMGRVLGDYFDILMDHHVEGFHYNVLRNPIYVGSTMCFAATALWCVSHECRMLVWEATRGLGLTFHSCRYERPASLLIDRTCTLCTRSRSSLRSTLFLSTSLHSLLMLPRPFTDMIYSTHSGLALWYVAPFHSLCLYTLSFILSQALLPGIHFHHPPVARLQSWSSTLGNHAQTSSSIWTRSRTCYVAHLLQPSCRHGSTSSSGRRIGV